MSEFADMVTMGFVEARAAFGVDFTVDGVSGVYRGVQRSTDELLPVGLGGAMDDYAGGLEYMSTEVTVPLGGKVTLGGVTYRVEHANSDSADPVRLVYLVGKDK